jgi:single-stranded-DNA-specific exonuclease
MKWEILGKSITSKKSRTSIVSTLLKNRGIKTEKEKKEFFVPTRPEKTELKAIGISKPEVAKAIKRIRIAKKNKEKVIIYGDYDADGICGTAILWESLYALGLNVLPYIPERFSEGYGLNAQSLEKLKTLNPKLKLIITVDHGIVAEKAVESANKLGIEVIITDHHEPGKVKPKAKAIVHTTKISGAAVAWVLAQEIKKQVGGLDLVAIGTIADQLPLTGLNRSFAKYGLEALNSTKRPGLLALFEQAGIKAGSIGTYEVGFMIAPRLNATGRLNHAIDSLRLLCVKNKEKAGELARHLQRTNLERQKIVDEVVLQTRARVQNKQGIIIVSGEYHEGVIGLAAAKLVDEFYRPAIVLSQKGGIAKASARSISGFNIIEAIRKLEKLYLEGGGHPMAAGFSIETIKIAEFTRKINQLAKPLLTKEILSKKLKIDLELHFNQLNYALYHELKKFEPGGIGNPAPTFVSYGVEVLESRAVGRDSAHLKLRLKQENVVFDAIAFGFGNLLPEITVARKIDLAYTIEDNSWNGRKSLQLKIRDIKIH